MIASAPQLLPLDQAAEHVGVDAAWLRGEADRGRIPVVKAGGRRLFEPAAIVAALVDSARHRDRLMLRLEEVAYMLGISTRSVWREVSAGALPKPQTIGRAKLWHRPTLERFLQERQHALDG